MELGLSINSKAQLYKPTMSTPIILFDFDGVILTHRALEFTAISLLRKKWFEWQNIEELRLIDFARLFEETEPNSGWMGMKALNRAYKRYIPSPWRRSVFFYKFNRKYRRLEKLYDTIKPNLEEALIKLKQAGIPLGIVSNTGRERLEYFVDKLGLRTFFSVMISRDDVPANKNKPHPYPIIKALVELKRKQPSLKIDKQNVYFVGDLPLDVRSAKAANVKSVALVGGHARKEDLHEANPTIILQNISELFKIEPFKKFL